MTSILTMMVQYALKLCHENTQIMIHRMTNTAHETLNDEVIIITIMEDSHTDLEEIVLTVEMLIITHIEIEAMVTNIHNLKEVVIKDDLVKVHGEADHMPDEPMAEANLLIKVIIVYQV